MEKVTGSREDLGRSTTGDLPLLGEAFGIREDFDRATAELAYIIAMVIFLTMAILIGIVFCCHDIVSPAGPSIPRLVAIVLAMGLAAIAIYRIIAGGLFENAKQTYNFAKMSLRQVELQEQKRVERLEEKAAEKKARKEIHFAGYNTYEDERRYRINKQLKKLATPGKKASEEYSKLANTVKVINALLNNFNGLQDRQRILIAQYREYRAEYLDGTDISIDKMESVFYDQLEIALLRFDREQPDISTQLLTLFNEAKSTGEELLALAEELHKQSVDTAEGRARSESDLMAVEREVRDSIEAIKKRGQPDEITEDLY